MWQGCCQPKILPVAAEPVQEHLLGWAVAHSVPLWKGQQKQVSNNKGDPGLDNVDEGGMHLVLSLKNRVMVLTC